jgi:hypothetical protein
VSPKTVKVEYVKATPSRIVADKCLLPTNEIPRGTNGGDAPK